MTLKKKSIIIFLLMLSATTFSFNLFIKFNELHNSIITNLFASGQILMAENKLHNFMREESLNIEDAKKIIKDITNDMMLIKEDVLTRDEFHKLVSVRTAFIRIERILMADNILTESELRQIHNELLKIGRLANEFRMAFKPRMEKQMELKEKTLISIYFLIGLSLVFLSVGLYRYFIRPITSLSSQVQKVMDKRTENITIYKGKDEIGNLSKFAYNAIGDLSKRLELQRATSKVLKAAQKGIDIDSFLKKTLDIILSIKWLNILQRGGILLVDETDPESLVLRAEKNYLESQKKACTKITAGRCICGKAAKEGRMIIKKCIDEEHEIKYEGLTPHGHICLPIKKDKRVLGVINLYIEENYIPGEIEIEFLQNISLIITETLEMKKLAEMEHIITTAIEESGEGVIIANRSGDIEYVNPAVEIITGYSEEEVRGINIFDNMKCWGIKEDVIKDIASGNIWSASLKSKRKDGKDYYERMLVIPVKTEGNEILKFASISRDITREKLLEEQLRQSQKMELIGTFAGGIAHDFNNILTAIKGYGSLLIEETKIKEDPDLTENVREILVSAERAANLTKNLLAFSSKQVVNSMPVTLNEIIKKMEELLLRLIGEDIELRIMLSKEELVVMADPSQIEQVLMNLAANARDAMPEGGKLTIETSQVYIDKEYAKNHLFAEHGFHAVLLVSDTGKGIDTETRERIFEPFFTTKEFGKGTGLGLSIVYSIIKQHDGNINVYSEPGVGTTFEIHLPLAGTMIEKIKIAEAAAPGSGTETILLAEDDDSVRKLIKETLIKYGYTVMEAVDGEDAVRIFMENRDKINILLFDTIMPKMKGPEAYEEIAKIMPGIKAIFMSGYTRDFLSMKKIREIGIDFLSKPVVPAEILTKIREVLER